MKKLLSFLLCAVVLLPLEICVVSAAANDIYIPGEVPKVFITSSASPSTEYSACKVEIIDEKGGSFAAISDEGSKFKIRGNSTSSGAKKPYNIKFSSKTDVLGMGKNKKWCLLANCYDKSLIRNQIVLDFARSIGLRYTPQYRVVEVYLNGKAQGCYLLIDAIQASSSRVDIDTDGNEFILERDARTDEGTTYFTTSRYGVRLGINEPEEQTPEQYKWLMNFMAAAETAIASGDFKQVELYFDIPSMVDFYITLEYFKNVDVDTGSTRFYIKDGKMYGGPCWDFDLSSGNCDYDYYWTYNNAGGSGDSAEGLWCNKLWYRPLLKYSEFSDAVKKRYLELQDRIVNLYADNRLGKGHVDSVVSEYGRVFNRNYSQAGWGIRTKYSGLEKAPAGSYSAEINYLKNWLKRRNEWMLSEYGLDTGIKIASGASCTLEGYIIRGISEKTTVAELKKMFVGEGIYCIDESGERQADAAFAGNGSSLTRGGASYTVVLPGDVVSDGTVSVADYIFIKRWVVRSIDPSLMTELRFAASDVDSSREIDAVDYIIVKRHVIGNFKIKG